jgi:hypothetical protein
MIKKESKRRALANKIKRKRGKSFHFDTLQFGVKRRCYN